ncbi:hypothetical protein MANES_10G101950v8 [Manihot esculenta]|uniref:Uncharacterized protein n=1 Tax=Manihot esculenta TaxID=3983 RepID=A0ACC8D295_MANES|nr:hypothetical protein MANES_10G101950v8 [Manihot esculenta]
MVLLKGEKREKERREHEEHGKKRALNTRGECL